MKLNPDCVRDILLKVEELPDLHHYYRFDETTIPALLPNYTFDEVIYHLRQCDMKGFFIGASHCMGYEQYTISDLSPDGHAFLANIRENKIWNGVKSIASQIGASSLDAFSQIAANVVTQLITSHFNL